jgi:predicted Rossmann-fold nucleotide-binding protein
MLPNGTISPEDLDLIYFTDDPDDAVRYIFEHTRQVRHPNENGAG